ncbi:porin [Burkholderia pseudomultivorans]|nr:porin [Burkholderia pseudomultivorans]EGD00287.1 porin Gram-negative type [Burkholderia sp. TJI49]KVC25046.1 porin [Burkholderia pseudomultivorans]KVC34864.1 porin [Burkholderia pseudomultivorans]KVC38249.1 porin [Burkholderia pseudomultivorans]
MDRMHRKLGFGVIGLTLMGVSEVLHAQSSVTLYGTVDTGLTYVSNQQIGSAAGDVGGKSAWSMTTGNLAPTAFGIRGTEDLGGGTSAVFNLQNYFLSNNGGMFQANNLFDATAMVGLRSDRWGQLTAGRQFDSYTNALAPFAISNNWAGPLGAHFGDIDNLNAAFNLNNSIQYQSPAFYGFSAGGTFSFGNQAGSFAKNRGWALAATWSHGPLSLGAGYLSLRNPLEAALGGSSAYIGELSCGQSPASYCALHDADELRTFGVGGSYVLDKLAVSAALTRATLVGSRYLVAVGGPVSDVRFDTAELSGLYNVTPALQIGLGYSYTRADIRTKDANTNIHKLSLGGIYSLSKRTQLYAIGNFEKMSGVGLGLDPASGAFENYAQLAYLGSANSSAQLAVSVGIKHNF